MGQAARDHHASPERSRGCAKIGEIEADKTTITATLPEAQADVAAKTTENATQAVRLGDNATEIANLQQMNGDAPPYMEQNEL
eukprot:COSAG06_NODE_3122_length_5818_cov_5.887917_2_plen_83_part_00